MMLTDLVLSSSERIVSHPAGRTARWLGCRSEALPIFPWPVSRPEHIRSVSRRIRQKGGFTMKRNVLLILALIPVLLGLPVIAQAPPAPPTTAEREAQAKAAIEAAKAPPLEDF